MAGIRDPFSLELFKNAMHSIADEMALTILRTAYSSVLKGSMDYSTAMTSKTGSTTTAWNSASRYA